MPNRRPDATPLLRRLAHFALGAMLVFRCTGAAALDPAVQLADYHHEIWTAKSGAPPNITTMAQTRDGWLWLGTTAGLYRFDGVRFSRFVDRNGAALPSGGVSSLHAKENGELLVGYLLGGMIALRDETFRTLASDTDLAASYQLTADVDDSVWAATVKGLLRYHDGRWTTFGADKGFPGAMADAVVLDHAGRLWASSRNDGLYLFDRARTRFVRADDGGTTDDIVPAPDGKIWQGRRGHWQLLPAPPGMPPTGPGHRLATSGASTGLFDRDGNHWALQCPTGICRIARARLHGLDRFEVARIATERLDQPWQLSNLTPQWILEDREGNIWVATRAGLERFRHNRLLPVPLPAGEGWFQVVDDDGGTLLKSSPRGFKFPAGATRFGAPGEYTLFATMPDGGRLSANEERITRTLGGVTTTIPLPTQPDGTPIKSMPVRLSGKGDEIWVAIAGHGVFRYSEGTWESARRYGTRKGLTGMATDDDGTTWMGFREGAVMRFRSGTMSTAVSNAGIGAIRLIDVQRGVVLAGEDGLAVLDKSGVHVLRAADPELLMGISGHALASNGDRWFNARRGAVHVSARAWEEALAQPGRLLQATLYDSLDGYPGAALTPGAFSTASVGRDGRVWFSTQTGVVYLDPARPYRNDVPPPVVIERLAVPGAARRTDGGYALPAGTTRVRIDYTALSYTKPERIRFRYRLEGLDKEWQDAGNRRSVSYDGLGPGTYRFHVTAVNEDGVPATAEAAIDIEIAPTVVQTTWFRLLCALFAIGLLVLAHRWRMRRLAQRLDERYRERLAERERISRALHDTLLQNMQALILRLHAAVKPMERGSEARGRIDAILDQADIAMMEAREELKGLRAPGGDGRADIGQALAAFGTGLQEQFHSEFKLFVGGTARPLREDAWQEIYFIGREALFNAYQHARARKIEVELTYGAGEFGLVVRDDGRGIDDDIQQRGGREGHWGLPGMKERAAALGGTLEWWSRAGLGTEVVARFPAARTYVQADRPGWRRRLLALLGRTGR
nr:triple tyrosine motif-containing protein [uncultured Massilia sp.]